MRSTGQNGESEKSQRKAPRVTKLWRERVVNVVKRPSFLQAILQLELHRKGLKNTFFALTCVGAGNNLHLFYDVTVPPRTNLPQSDTKIQKRL
jgi:hypothetical protein